ncbi:hypothetical protein [Breoghania sp. L-A4]|uniref:hypothetical protein n=1 Tax=Breoghania sp. L-A4 TaxID=2304600 RepID=UPI0013C339D3|nr:hypothetical protein [Breoghania sp. L-A4]
MMMNFHASPDGHGMSMELARNIVRAAIPAIEEQMPLIRDTSAVFRLDEGFKSVFIGRLTVGAFQGGPIAFCGTGADLAQLTTDGADILGIMLSNITAAAAVLRQRAERAGIDLAVELWGNAG